MFKSKKAIFAFAVVLVILIAMGTVLFAANSRAEIYSEIGSNQVNMLNAYSEAEKAREYVKFSALHSAALVSQELNVAARQNCYSGIDATAFKTSFAQKMTNYLGKYASTDQLLNISALDYTYAYTFQNNAVEIKCSTLPGIVVESNKLDFTYSTIGYVKINFTCNDYLEYSRTRSFVV